MKLRVLTYNIHKGFCFYSRQYVLREVRRAIQEVQADVVFLQEVMGNHPEVQGPDLHLKTQFEYLADTVWQHYAYGKNAVYDSGSHGNAILSQYPFLSWENINISTNRFERRGVLHGCIEIPQLGQLHLMCLHLDLLARGRRQQVGAIIERVGRHVTPQDPLLIAGDFNDWQQQVSDTLERELNMKEVAHHLTGEHAATYPSWLPMFSLDRIYFRGLKPVSCEVLGGPQWRRLSDHAAVLAQFDII